MFNIYSRVKSNTKDINLLKGKVIELKDRIIELKAAVADNTNKLNGNLPPQDNIDIKNEIIKLSADIVVLNKSIADLQAGTEVSFSEQAASILTNTQNINETVVTVTAIENSILDLQTTVKTNTDELAALPPQKDTTAIEALIEDNGLSISTIQSKITELEAEIVNNKNSLNALPPQKDTTAIEADITKLNEDIVVLNGVVADLQANQPIAPDLTEYAKKILFSGTHPTGQPFELPLLNAIENSQISTSSYIEMQAEINRQLGASGVYSTRQYTADESFNSAERIWDTGYGAISMHNHPNYRGMPGSAEFSAIINGYYIRSRHNDYRAFSPVAGGYLARKEILPPEIPAAVLASPVGTGTGSATPFEDGTQYKYMRDVYQNNPEDCVFYMSYIECWWEQFDNNDVGDNTDSFRHATDAANMKEALEKALYFNAGGHKNRKENIPYQPIIVRRVNDQGVSELATFRYRISVYPVATLSSVETTKTFTYSDGSTIDITLAPMAFDEAKSISGTIASDNKFLLRRDLRQRWRDNRTESNARTWESIIRTQRAAFNLQSGQLRKLCETIPGLLGPDGIIEESYADYGFDDVLTDFGTLDIRNAAFYNKRYSFANSDAVGRTSAHRGFNDPNLFVAKTDDAKVVDGFTYMIPYEMVLRTTRENWNPDNIPDLGKAVTHAADFPDGETSATAMPGMHYNNYNFMLPADLFADPNSDDFDVADTRFAAWINSTGAAKQYYASGIKIFDYDGMRRRFAVFANYHDFSKASGDLDILKKEMKLLLKGINAGTITDTDIDQAF